LISLLVSVALLIGLYLSIDIWGVGAVLRRAHAGWLVVSVCMIAPITVFRAMRFAWVVPAGALSGLGEALRLTLVASAFNMFLPTKAGDLVKSFFVARGGGASPGVAVAVIVYERLNDLFGLMFWCLVAWMLGPPPLHEVPSLVWLLVGAAGALFGILILSERAADLCLAVANRLLPHRKLKVVRDLAEGWPTLHRRIRKRRGGIALFSVFLWLVHLTQIWMFAIALGVHVPFLVCLSLSSAALMAGQLPFTFNGLGARDVALVVLLSGYATPEAGAALGILTASRGLLPPLAALPILRPYVTAVIDAGQAWRRG
jgi:uncharacterized membrane protein YbhN (UPF0104 family)